MRTRSFGRTGRSISVMGQGTWLLDDEARPEALAALRAGLDAGMTHIDTAEMYGEAEPLVAEAIDGRREEVFLVSKVLPQNAGRARTIAACERSLARLRTDRLDCYLLHWRGSVPLAETFEAFETLRRQGKILSFGVSNFDEDDLAEAVAIAGEGHIACNQVLYHPGERAIEHAVLPFCEEHGIALVAYSPFGHGAFPRPGSPGRRVLDAVAAETGGSARQVALAFLARHPAIFPIPKASSPAHARDNAAAAGLVLSAAQVDRIDAAFPRGRKPSHLPMI